MSGPESDPTDAADARASGPVPRGSAGCPSAAARSVPFARTTGDRVLAAVCIGAIAFLLLQLLTFGYGRDQGIYAVVARSILEGGMPYRDAWDFKPPGIFVVFALARVFFGDAQYGVRVLEAVGLLATVAGMMRLADRLWGDRLMGLAAGAIYVLVHTQLDFWHTSQPESFGGMVTIFGLLLALRGGHREACGEGRAAALAWIASGVLFGIAGLLKPPLAGGGAVLAAIFGWKAFRDATANRTPESSPSARRPLGLAVRPALFIALGGVLPIAMCLAWFAYRGALRDLYEVLFVFTPHYTAIGWEGSSAFGMLYYGFVEWFTNYSSVVTVSLLLLLGFGIAPRERFGVVLLVSVIAVHILGVALQGKFFPYHYGATWPLTAMLAALGLFKARERLGRPTLWTTAIFLTGVVMIALGRSATKDVPGSFLRRCGQRIQLFTETPRDQEAIDRLASIADVNAVSNRAAATFIRAHVPPGRPIFVWGFEPVIYDLADRPTSSRYIYNVAQRVAWAKTPAREALLRDLNARPPAAIVVEHNDVFPMVTGDAIDSANTLHDFAALRHLLASRYDLAASFGGLDVFLELP